MLARAMIVLALLLVVSGCTEKVDLGEEKPLKTPVPHPKHQPRPKLPQHTSAKAGEVGDVKKVGKTERIKRKWIQLAGLDGGDMHFVFSTNSGTLFLSHGFGGVWRSENGEKWDLIAQSDFVDLNFYDMEEVEDRLYAATNKGLWYSDDDGKTWRKIETGFDYVDGGKYHVVSVTRYGDEVCFTAVLDKAYRNGKAGDGKLLCMKDGDVREVSVPANKEITVSARYPLMFLSSPYSGLYVFDGKGWEKILDAKTTRVFVDENYNLYAGTIGEWWYVGEYGGGKRWEWKQIRIDSTGIDESKVKSTIFHFILPDPLNSRRLWFGCGGVATFYSTSSRASGIAFVGVGCWDGSSLSGVKLNPNYATSIAFYGGEVRTPCGKATRFAFVTVGGQAVQKTEDGGLSWHNSYEGVYGDTINAINPITSGILSGSIVVTAVSGIEIAIDHGDSWMSVDFRIGKVEGRLPGYSWCAASPDERVEGRYDLFVSTGYPGNFGGDGVFGVDLSCVSSGNRNCIERLIEGAHYEMVVVDGKLYAGSMDDGVDILDLKTMKKSKINIGGAGVPLVRLFDGRLYFETYRGKYLGDGWRWTGRSGEVYAYDGELKLVYGEYVINFFVRNGEFVGLTQNSLIYKPNALGGEVIRADLPPKKYTDMAVDWDGGLIFLSTDGEGVFYTTLDQLRSGKVDLTEMNDGLLTLKVRNLAYYDGYLFAGTRGLSVWRVNCENG